MVESVYLFDFLPFYWLNRRKIKQLGVWYTRKKYHERMSKFEEKVNFKRIDQKYKKRERSLKATIDDTEIVLKMNRKKYRNTWGTKGTEETGKGKKKLGNHFQ
jgi:hypothetical protein